MKRMNTIIAVIVVIMLTLGIFITAQNGRRTITVDINTDGLAYLVGNCRGLGPKRLNYSEHQAMIDYAVETLSGEYTYKKTWSNQGFSGGGPNIICFFAETREQMHEIMYVDGFIAISTPTYGKFYLYEKMDGELSLAGFEKYLNRYGTAQRTLT